jgi:signal transduction histidine kinase
LTEQCERLVQANAYPAAGSREADRQIVDLPELIEEIVRDAVIEADVREVKIRVESDAVVPVVADGDLLRVVIENILRNAVRHTASSSTVAVRVQREEGELSVTVSDKAICDSIFSVLSSGHPRWST